MSNLLNDPAVAGRYLEHSAIAVLSKRIAESGIPLNSADERAQFLRALELDPGICDVETGSDFAHNVAWRGSDACCGIKELAARFDRLLAKRELEELIQQSGLTDSIAGRTMLVDALGLNPEFYDVKTGHNFAYDVAWIGGDVSEISYLFDELMNQRQLDRELGFRLPQIAEGLSSQAQAAYSAILELSNEDHRALMAILLRRAADLL